MKHDHVRRFLEQSMVDLEQARQHLDYSYQQVAGLPESLKGITDRQRESVEAFSSRFARTVDLLVNQVLRSIDRMELKTEGTLLDAVNRAEKRGFVTDASDLREMKDVRNVIAHDYAGAKAAEIFAYCREQKPVLDAICDRVATYIGQLLNVE